MIVSSRRIFYYLIVVFHNSSTELLSGRGWKLSGCYLQKFFRNIIFMLFPVWIFPSLGKTIRRLFCLGFLLEIGISTACFAPGLTHAQDGIKIEHTVSSNHPGAILLPPPKSSPLAACPQFPGTDEATSRVLAPAYNNFPIEFQFRDKPKTEVYASASRNAPGYLTDNPDRFRTEKTIQGWTDEAGVYKFFFVISKQDHPLEKPLDFSVSANAGGSMDGQEALVTVGLGLEIDPRNSKLIPVTYSSDTTQSAAWFVSPRSRFHPSLDVRQYFENVLNCKEQKMGLPLIIVDALWNGVTSSSVGFSYLEPAPPALNGPRFLRPANGVGALFGSTYLPRFDFPVSGNHTTTWVKGTTVVISRDGWNQWSRDAWSHPEEHSFEPSFFPPGFFLIAPFEQIESVQESAACALQAQDDGQRVILAALEMIPKFGQGVSVIGHLAASLCQFARGNDTQALQTLLNGGLKEAAEWLVFDQFAPDKLRAWNNKQAGQLKMDEAQIIRLSNRMQSAYKGGLFLQEVGKSSVPESIRKAEEQRVVSPVSSVDSSNASAVEPLSGIEQTATPQPTQQTPEVTSSPSVPTKKPTREEFKASARRTQDLQKQLERATKEGRSTAQILDEMTKELDAFQQMYENDK